ncbi:MAG: rod shape-determining protein MreC [Acidimicrobiales bacterium]
MAKPRRSRRTLITLLVLVLVSVTVISLDESGRTHGITSGIKSVATDVFSPFRTGVQDVVHPIGDFFAGAVDYGSLQQENEQLRAENARLRQQSAEEAHAKAQLRQLDHLLRTHDLPSVGTLRTVTAETVARGQSDFTVTITIDKGRSSGVAVTDPVVGGGGLVGKVVQASHSTAEVQLITDGQATVPVTFGTPPTYALLQGEGPGKALKATFISPEATVRAGTRMFTNAQAGATYPPGIPVGRVTSVHTVPGATHKDVAVEPLADLRTLAYVQVLQWSTTP